MAAISVGSVEVDVVPNTRGIRARLQSSLMGPANSVGEEMGRVIGRHISTQVAQAVRDGVTAGGRTAQAPAARQGQSTGSTFARSLRTAMETALRNLPEIRLHANSSDAQREIYQVRAQLQALQSARIGIDISSADAVAAIERIQAQLQRLSASDADVDVRVDAASAASALAAVQAQVSALDGQTARVDVDASTATANMRLLVTAGLALGPALLPTLPVIAAGLGAVAAAATAAGAGIGAIALVAAPAIMGITKTLQAQKAAQDAATTAALKGGQAASQAASRALQMASAQQALVQAERNGARQIAQAQGQLRQARQAAADAVAQAARRVQDAERSLADAQRDARRAQDDLTQARRDARQELEDLTSRLANARLSERDAVLAVQDAQDQLRAVQEAGAAVSLREQERAQLAYDQAVQRLADQRAETQRLATEKKGADKAGVEGSETVRNAQQRLEDAQRRVADQTRAVQDAQREGARQIAAAQERVAEATANVAHAQQAAADAVASAQRQIESAALSAAGGVDQAAIAQAKYQQELAKLTPAARQTLRAFEGLKDAFGEWSRSLQPDVMPIFTRALNGMKNSLPGLTPLVREAAAGISELQDRASAGFKSPWWKSFKKDLEGSVRPAIVGLGVSFGNIFKGMVGVVDAFLPHMDSISERMQRATKRFADWGSSLKGNPEFEEFLAYAADTGPQVAETFRSIMRAGLKLGQALAPVGEVMLVALQAVADAVSWLADNCPGLIITIYALILASRLWSVGILAVAAAQRIWNGALIAFNLISKAGPWGWIIMILGLVVAAVIWAYNEFEWFRRIVDRAWRAIGAVIDWVWVNVIKPVWDAMQPALEELGRICRWLWENTIRPVWQAMGRVISWVWHNLIKPAWKAMGEAAVRLWHEYVRPAFQRMRPVFIAVGQAVSWLWLNLIKPYWKGIGQLAMWLWREAIKPAFDRISAVLKAAGAGFRWLWHNAVKPSWTALYNGIWTSWRKYLKPTFDALQRVVDRIGGTFSAAASAAKRGWDRLKAIARTPVQYVVDVVYNHGLRGAWNVIASAFGAKKLPAFKFASGGVMPGYTPGRDVHKFVSPTGGALELSGGEAIMRPEFTRAVGSGFVHSLNAVARSRGAEGVKAALAPALAGNPPTPTDRSLRYSSGGTVQRFADGGIFDWIKSTAASTLGAGTEVWNRLKERSSWLGDTLKGSTRAGIDRLVKPLLAAFPGGSSTAFGAMIRRVPLRMVDTLLDYAGEADKRGAGGIGGPKVQAALRWARAQAGKPYIWGGVGPRGFDCSGFMGAIENVLRGLKPNSRRWATMAFSGRTAPPGWVKNGNSPFRVGITNAGVGHTAGTLGKVNVESRGGDGVVVGSRARGYRDRLFTDWYGFMPGKFDNGGMLQPGFNLAYNGTGKPEPVLTGAQFNALARGRQEIGDLHVSVFVGDREITDIARAEVRTAQGELIQVLTAS
ncbi:hypothetical protein [Streptomyces sp. MJP52]|uniref:hypothetical protein n=1 Tax=Streptomyces sp. MJP52 TaxID=2940555 RepID=UPI002473E3C0|nr:hypothetical protein [Streptomyces sp. MJP52]MDH6224365.1 hypothetical protein [Streptomyces sp. MJP52]